MVAPKGSVKLLIDLGTPKFSSVLFMVIGRVAELLAVVKEKTIAAKKAKVKTVIYPFENKKDFDELPDYIKKGLNAYFVNYFDEVLEIVY